MTNSNRHPGRADIVTWSITIACLALTCLTMAMTSMIDLGAKAHDAFCPDHGWAVERT